VVSSRVATSASGSDTVTSSRLAFTYLWAHGLRRRSSKSPTAAGWRFCKWPWTVNSAPSRCCIRLVLAPHGLIEVLQLKIFLQTCKANGRWVLAKQTVENVQRADARFQAPQYAFPFE
jgi:hypothetical protein